MRQIGIVTAVESGYSIVEVSRKSACEGCHANADGNCSACITIGKRTTVCRAENLVGAKVGDRVAVETESGTVLLYAAAVFLFPLILAVIGYFAATFIPYEAAPYIGAVSGFVIAFPTVVFTLNRKASKRLDVKIVQVLK